MRELIKKFIIFLILLSFTICPIQAKDRIILHGDVNEKFTLKYNELPKELTFKTSMAKTIPNIITIPENSDVTVEIIDAQKERRWHKSGYILCKLKSYTPESISVPIDVSDRNIYLVVRKYEEVNVGEATLFGIELVLAQGASVFAPGVDIAYFFTKGAIQREKHPNWFKAGVHNAYENSICWFWLKGKPIELDLDDSVCVKNITEEKASKLKSQIEKRKEKQINKSSLKIAKADKKLEKKIKKIEKRSIGDIIAEKVMEQELSEGI